MLESVLSYEKLMQINFWLRITTSLDARLISLGQREMGWV